MQRGQQNYKDKIIDFSPHNYVNKSQFSAWIEYEIILTLCHINSNVKNYWSKLQMLFFTIHLYIAISLANIYIWH